MVKQKKGYKRGYPVALLLGFEADHAAIWQVFSHVVKLHVALKLEGKRTDEKCLFSFHEAVTNSMRPMLTEGIKSIVVTAPPKTTYASDFLDHVQKHHSYLVQSRNPNRATLAVLTGSADQTHKVAELVKTKRFTDLIAETTSWEADHTLNALEKCLSSVDNNCVVLYALKEIEDRIYGAEKHSDAQTEYLMLTDKFLADSKDKNRINRLLQISKNKKIRTRVVNTESSAGKRISQLGGIVFFSAKRLAYV